MTAHCRFSAAIPLKAMMEQSALAAAARISFHVLIMLDHSAVIPGVA